MILDIKLNEKKNQYHCKYYEVTILIKKRFLGIVPYYKRINTLIGLVKYMSKRLHCETLNSLKLIMASKCNYVEKKLDNINVIILTNKDMFYEGNLVLYAANVSDVTIKRGIEYTTNALSDMSQDIVKLYAKKMVKEMIQKILNDTPILFNDSKDTDLRTYCEEHNMSKYLIK